MTAAYPESEVQGRPSLVLLKVKSEDKNEEGTLAKIREKHCRQGKEYKGLQVWLVLRTTITKKMARAK